MNKKVKTNKKVKMNKKITITSLIEDLRKTLTEEQLKEVDIQFYEYLKRKGYDDLSIKYGSQED